MSDREVLGMVAEVNRSVAQSEHDLDITPGLFSQLRRAVYGAQSTPA
jgi:hypothetical protein